MSTPEAERRDRLADMTVLITGASSGIGNRLARFLIDRRSTVIVSGRREHPLRELADLRPDRVLALPFDVGDFSAVAEGVRAAHEWAGRIDGLVTAAGINNFVPAEEESPEDFARVVNVNLSGLYACCHYVGRIMLDQGGGSIVNMASINGHVASDGEASYVASKTGVVGLSRELAVQWATRGIRVNTLSPGYFPSEMTAHLYDDPAGLARISRAPMGRPGHPHELNGALEFLLTDASSFVTGHSLLVDGGLTVA